MGKGGTVDHYAFFFIGEQSFLMEKTNFAQPNLPMRENNSRPGRCSSSWPLPSSLTHFRFPPTHVVWGGGTKMDVEEGLYDVISDVIV